MLIALAYLFTNSSPTMALFIILLVLFSIPVSFQQDQFIFNGFHGPNTNITLSGSAQVSANGNIQLTNYSFNLIGQMFYAIPLRFKNSTSGSASSFSTCFAFSINNHTGNPNSSSGDGIAFFIAQSTNFSYGHWGSQFGLFNDSGQVQNLGNHSNSLLVVEFDTYLNDIFGDINDNHVSIDINSLLPTNSATAGYIDNDLHNHTINLKGGQPIMVWIDYDSLTNLFNVTLSVSSSKPRRPILSLQLDMSSILEQDMFVGFSASTGGGPNSAQNLLGWSFNVNGEADPLNLSVFPLNLSPRVERKKHSGLITIGISIGAFFFVIISSIIVFFLIRKFRNVEVIDPWDLEIGPQRYNYFTLKKATRGFKDSQLLGSGGFGQVYRGTLPNGDVEVAVKRISHESKQGLREFVSEISTIGRLRHRNLVQLLGWCRRGSDLLLVYEFMPNASLDRFLFGEPECVLSWKQRFNIIKGVASGLLYLHEGYEQVVIHRDVKASNVLLDGEMNGKLGDFGLAKLHERGSDPCTSRIVGTLGYVAPEFSRTGRSTTSSDVFSFGNLILAVACGRKPIELNATSSELLLSDYVWFKYQEGTLFDVVDQKMNDDFDENEVLMVLKLGLMCTSTKQVTRPSMRQLVSYLDGEVELPAVLSKQGSAYGDEKICGEANVLRTTAPGNVNMGNSFPSISMSYEIPR